MKSISVKQAQIPVLGLGTYGLRGQVASKLVLEALQLGYRHIDTAQFYDNEAEVGQGIRQSPIDRAEVFLTTKVWPTNLDRKHFLPSVAESLRKLNLDYVDLLLIHWPNTEVPLEESVSELMQAQEKGYTRYIGVSNFNVDLLQRTLDLGADILNNQVEYHVMLSQEALQNEIQARGLSLTAYSPIAQGKVLNHPVIKPIAEAHGKQETQIALRWLIDQPGVMAIPRTSKPERLRENMDIFDIRLSPEERAQLDSLSQQRRRLVHAPWAPKWD